MGSDSSFWHPFAAMGAVRGAEFVLTRGEDVWVFDDAGTRTWTPRSAPRWARGAWRRSSSSR